jgi:sigma-E factor negative regulatory protein RseA
MSNTDKESLSALIDNETDDLELRRLLKAVELDSDLQSTWERMNLVQAVLHDDNVQHSAVLPLVGSNFADKVAKAIAAESGPSVNPKLINQWGKSFAKLGIAASVALAFFLGMQTIVTQQDYPGSGAAPLAQQSEQLDPQPLTGIAQNNDSLVAESPIQQVDPEARQRLEDYIRSVSIRPEEPAQLENLQDSPLYRLVNEIQNSQ